MSPELTEKQGIRRFTDEAIQRQIDHTTKMMDQAAPGVVVASVDYVKGGMLSAAIVAKTTDGQWTVMVEGYKSFGSVKDAGGRLGVRWTPP